MAATLIPLYIWQVNPQNILYWSQHWMQDYYMQRSLNIHVCLAQMDIGRNFLEFLAKYVN